MYVSNLIENAKNLTEDQLKAKLALFPPSGKLTLTTEEHHIPEALTPTALNRGTQILQSLTISSLEDDSITLRLTDPDLQGVLKNFLEQREFVVLYSNYVTRLFLAYDIRLNIVDDAQLLVYCRNPQLGLPKSKVLLGGENPQPLWLAEINSIRYIVKEYAEEAKTDVYANLLKTSKLMAFGSYFGIPIDIDQEAHSQTLFEKKERSLALKDEFWRNYDINPNSRHELNNYFQTNYHVPFTVINARSLSPTCKIAEDVIEIITLDREIHVLKRPTTEGLRYSRDFKILSRLPLLALPTSDINIIHTNPKKHYYLSIDAPAVIFRYLDKINFDKTIGDVDYHAFIASEVFGIPLDQVTKEQRRDTKDFNFYRLSCIRPYNVGFIRDNTLARLGNKLDFFKSKLPLWRNSRHLEFTKLFLMALAKTQTALEEADLLTKVTLFYEDHPAFIFRVSNKVNPYKLMQLLSEAFDTTAQVGFKLYDNFCISNKLGDILRYPILPLDVKENRYVFRDMNTAFAKEMYSRNETRKFRNIISEVTKDFENYMK